MVSGGWAGLPRAFLRSIMWMRAMESEKMGQQQPSRMRPQVPPGHWLVKSMQQHLGM